MAQAPHIPTDEQRSLVKDLYAGGVPQERIADRIGISADVLRKYYREELDFTVDGMMGALAKNLYQDALGGDEKAREFWLKTRGRWSYAKPPEEPTKDDKVISLLEQLNESIKKG